MSGPEYVGVCTRPSARLQRTIAPTALSANQPRSASISFERVCQSGVVTDAVCQSQTLKPAMIAF